MASTPRKPPTITIVIKNLPVGTTKEEVMSLCAHCGGVAEVEIPSRANLYTKFLFAFVRFVSLDSALHAISKLNGLMLQRRRLNVQLARNHWRNTNEHTVLHDEHCSEPSKVEEPKLSEEEMNASILQMCNKQWQYHRKRNRDRDLPSFTKIMEIISSTTDGDDEIDGIPNLLGEESREVNGIQKHRDNFTYRYKAPQSYGYGNDIPESHNMHPTQDIPDRYDINWSHGYTSSSPETRYQNNFQRQRDINWTSDIPETWDDPKLQREEILEKRDLPHFQHNTATQFDNKHVHGDDTNSYDAFSPVD